MSKRKDVKGCLLNLNRGEANSSSRRRLRGKLKWDKEKGKILLLRAPDASSDTEVKSLPSPLHEAINAFTKRLNRGSQIVLVLAEALVHAIAQLQSRINKGQEDKGGES